MSLANLKRLLVRRQVSENCVDIRFKPFSGALNDHFSIKPTLFIRHLTTAGQVAPARPHFPTNPQTIGVVCEPARVEAFAWYTWLYRSAVRQQPAPFGVALRARGAPSGASPHSIAKLDGALMDHFENIISTLLEAEGYWVRQSFKVNLTKEEKRLVGKPSIPRPEIDLLALNFSRNEVLVLEAKSFLDSPGVKLNDLQPSDEVQKGWI